MIAVIFEVKAHCEKEQEYFDYAEELAPIVQNAKGLISIERFESRTNSGKVLSLSFWEDEASVKAWRNNVMHRQIQQKARANTFAEYRIRVAYVDRD
ncbi:MAG: antibiotic biosynthesis monooxygenase family protein [Vibrio gallaecicus]